MSDLLWPFDSWTFQWSVLIGRWLRESQWAQDKPSSATKKVKIKQWKLEQMVQVFWEGQPVLYLHLIWPHLCKNSGLSSFPNTSFLLWTREVIACKWYVIFIMLHHLKRVLNGCKILHFFYIHIFLCFLSNKCNTVQTVKLKYKIFK